MRLLLIIPIAIGSYWLWLPLNEYYFQQSYSVQKPAETHGGPWFDGTGWRPGQ